MSGESIPSLAAAGDIYGLVRAMALRSPDAPTPVQCWENALRESGMWDDRGALTKRLAEVVEERSRKINSLAAPGFLPLSVREGTWEEIGHLDQCAAVVGWRIAELGKGVTVQEAKEAALAERCLAIADALREEFEITDYGYFATRAEIAEVIRRVLEP